MTARAPTHLPRPSRCVVLKSLRRDEPLKEKQNMTCPTWGVLRSWEDIRILTRHQRASFHCLCHLHAMLLKPVHITNGEFTFNLEKNIKVCRGVQGVSGACSTCGITRVPGKPISSWMSPEVQERWLAFRSAQLPVTKPGPEVLRLGVLRLSLNHKTI